MSSTFIPLETSSSVSIKFHPIHLSVMHTKLLVLFSEIIQLVSAVSTIRKVKSKSWTQSAASEISFAYSECTGFGCWWSVRFILQIAQCYITLWKCPKPLGILRWSVLGASLWTPRGFSIAVINVNTKRTLFKINFSVNIIFIFFYFFKILLPESYMQ